MKNNQYALQWAAAEQSSFSFPSSKSIARTTGASSLPRSRRFAGPGQNFVYADVDGNIGYHATGRLPIRKKCAGDVPADGAAGGVRMGRLYFRRGVAAILQSAIWSDRYGESKSISGRLSIFRSGNFDPAYRALQIRALLEARAQWQTPDMLKVQKMFTRRFRIFWRRQVVAAWMLARRRIHSYGRRSIWLRNWTGQMERARQRRLVAALTFQQLRKAAAERAAPGSGQSYEFRMARQ